MNNCYSSETYEKHDEYPEVTQDDLDRAISRVGLKPVSSHKQQITILMDTVLIEYFKAKAGSTDYQKLINDTLRQAIEHKNLETTLRHIIRKELDYKQTLTSH